MSLQDEASGGSRARAGTAITVPEAGSCSPDMELPWRWVLESFLDVKNLPLPFFRDILPYVPHIEQPQCSKLLQKLALTFLDEGAVTGKIDSSDVLLLKFISKEQGVSDLRRIHSLKESFEKDLTLRVETETVLSNLRSNDGRVEWAAFGAAVDNVFAEDSPEPRRVERRTELAAVLLDPSNGDSEVLCEQLLKKYPLEELRRDLAQYIGDKRESFKIKFLDQLVKDFEDGVYSCLCSPCSDSPETRRPLKLLTDVRNGCQVQDDARQATALPGSSSPKNNCTTTDKDGDRRPCNLAAGANIPEPKDVRAEMSFRMAEVVSGLASEDFDEVANGLASDFHDFVKDIAKFTEYEQNTASVPFSTPGLSNQKISGLAAPNGGNPLWLQQSPVVICPTKRAEGDLVIDKPLHTFASVARTSRISRGKDAKRASVEVSDQDTDVAKKRKLDHVELSEGATHQMAAAGNVRDMLDDVLSSDNVHNLFKRFSKTCANDLPAAGVVECCVCGSSDGSQVFCHQCPVSIHEGCLSELGISQANARHCWHCFTCAAKLAQQDLVKAQEGVKEANEALRKAEEVVATVEEGFLTFVSAKTKRSRSHPEDQTASIEFRQATLCGEIPDTTVSVHAEQGSPMEVRSDPEEDRRGIFAKIGTVTSTMVRSSDASVQNVMKDHTGKHVGGIRKETVMHTAHQASVLREGLDGDRDNDVPDANLLREEVERQVSTSVPVTPVSLGGPSPEDKGKSGCCGKEQVEGPRCSPSDPLSNSRNPAGEEGDGHDGDLEEVCEGSLAAAGRANAAEQSVGGPSERISEASNVRGKLGPRHVYRRTRRRKHHVLYNCNNGQFSSDSCLSLHCGEGTECFMRHLCRGRKKIPGVRRQSLPWTGIEEDILKEGVKMHSNGGQWGFHWARILDFGAGKFHESRTAVDLKDKWRNMQRSRPVSSDLPS